MHPRLSPPSILIRCLPVLLAALIVLAQSGCVQTTVSGKPLPNKNKFRLPSESPMVTVKGYLGDLGKQDFGGSYDHLSFEYAGNLDKASYELNMRNGLVESLKWDLKGFKILGVRIVGMSAYVISELNVSYVPPTTGELVDKQIKIQYELTPIDKKWTIVGDACIENCSPGPGAEQPSVEFRQLEQ